MKVVIINKSDSTGGAAIVSLRLMNALRNAGVDATMLVTEKKHDSPYVELAASPSGIKRAFLAERLKIFLANGLDRSNLFKVDTASDGLPVYRHRFVREADIICLNWVNQGLLSFRGLKELLKLGKPVVWTMHDMWNFTGICHHAGDCNHWHGDCGDCKFLGKNASPADLSFTVHKNKAETYSLATRLSRHSTTRLHFVAVSNWLADLARRSSLLENANLSVIHNAFPIPEETAAHKPHDKFRIVMGAARLDDPVKGLPILVETTKILKDKYPADAKDMELITFGNIKNPDSIEGIAISHRHLGVINGEKAVRDVYADADAVVSTSLFETLPGTLVEGQVYGCIPVSFGRGGQADIIDHLKTGYIAEWNDDLRKAAGNIAEGLIWAKKQNAEDMRKRMYEAARSRFDATVIAARYIDLFNILLSPDNNQQVR